MQPAEHTISTSSSLIDRVRAFDSEAWSRLSDLYGPIVYHWARRGGLQSSDAADVAQEVFRTVAVRIGSFRRDQPGDSFRGWLWGITRNKLLEFYRSRAGEPAAPGGSTAQQRLGQWAESLPADSDAWNGASIRCDVIQRTVTRLQDEFEASTWQSFYRMVVREEPAAEIAGDLEMTAKAVRQAKFRVLRRLREELRDLL